MNGRVVLYSLLFAWACRQSPKLEDSGSAEVATPPTVPTESATDSDPPDSATDTGRPDTGRDCTPPAPALAELDLDCPPGVAALIGNVAFGGVGDAVSAAMAGDVVEICAGSWPTNATIRVDLTLRGRAGRDATVLDGGGRATVLTVLDGTDVRIEGVTIACGASEDEGGGINGTANVAHARLIDNYAVSNGGGMASSGGYALVGPDVVFERNVTDGRGGGVDSSTLDFVDVTFDGNEAGGRCGGFAVWSGWMSRVTAIGNQTPGDGGGGCILTEKRCCYGASVTDSVFTDNRAGGDGGGVYAENDLTSGGIFVGRISFRDNVADRGGGGYANCGVFTAPVYVLDSDFSGNAARLGGGLGACWGSVRGGTFSDNVASEAGGAVYFDGIADIVGASLVRNVAPVGGGIGVGGTEYWSGDLAFIGDLGADVDDNIGGDIGLLTAGVTYDDLGDDEIAACTLDGCAFAPRAVAAALAAPVPRPTTSAWATEPACADGVAAIVEEIGFVSVADAVAAAPAGGAVSICPGEWPADLLITEDLELIGLGGAGLARLDGEHTHRVLTVEEGVTLVLTGVGVVRGRTDDGGGGLWVRGAVVATDVEISDCSASDGGGVQVDGELTWSGGAVRDNRAYSWGGGIAVGVGRLEMDGVLFERNWAESSGGAIAATDSGAAILLSDVTFTANHAGYSGGAVSDRYGATTIAQADCSENVAGEYGGCLSVAGGRVAGLVATGNVAGSSGGAIDGTVVLTTSSLVGNRARWGGGAYLGAGAAVSDSNISGNRASSGGGVFASGAVSLTSTAVEDNRALTAGGLYVSSTATVVDSAFTRNLANTAGGAYVGVAGVLTSTSTDWGVDLADNVPDDVAGSVPSANYGDAASFICDGARATCE